MGGPKYQVYACTLGCKATTFSRKMDWKSHEDEKHLPGRTCTCEKLFDKWQTYRAHCYKTGCEEVESPRLEASKKLAHFILIEQEKELKRIKWARENPVPEPYACTLGCKNALFRTRTEWTFHEAKVHHEIQFICGCGRRYTSWTFYENHCSKKGCILPKHPRIDASMLLAATLSDKTKETTVIIQKQHCRKKLPNLYACVLGCDSTTNFRNLNDWLLHEQRVHKVTWVCFGQCGREFKTRKHYLAHRKKEGCELRIHPRVEESKDRMEEINARNGVEMDEWYAKAKRRGSKGQRTTQDDEGASEQMELSREDATLLLNFTAEEP